VSAEEVDEYLRGLDKPKRSTLQALRRTILEIVPDAEQVISYRVPAFRVSGETVAGFAAFKDHLSYLPFGGSVLGQLAHELKGYTLTKSSLHFPVDRPLPKSVVRNLIAVRLAELRHTSRESPRLRSAQSATASAGDKVPAESRMQVVSVGLTSDRGARSAFTVLPSQSEKGQRTAPARPVSGAMIETS
jgi:uncharacterized protein YdhG (YjbR/CyaY superfamily)